MILVIINFILLSLLIGMIVYLFNIDKVLIKKNQDNEKNIENIATIINSNNDMLESVLIK